MIYEASRIKRSRATAGEMLERRRAIAEIVAEQHPATVRQVFYQASVRGVVEKTEAGYNKVQRALVDMRREGEICFDRIADNTRWQRKPATFNSPAEALSRTASFYRKSLWADADVYAEVWLEKDALASVIYEVTQKFDVSLMVTRGYGSLSFLHEAAMAISEQEVPSYIYHLGDHDPSGVDAANKVEATLREFAPEAEIHFERLAVLPVQIFEMDLPSRPTKKSDSRAKGFSSVSVELDAIPAPVLRQLVEGALLEHLPQQRLDTLLAAEQSERALIARWAEAAQGGAA